MMKQVTATELRRNLSKFLEKVQGGETIAITYGRKKEIRALLVPHQKERKLIKLGTLEGTGSFKFRKGYKMTEEELCEGGKRYQNKHITSDQNKPNRKLGLLKGKSSFKFIGGHNTTLEEFFGE